MTNTTATTTTDCTLHEAAEACLQHLRQAGKKERTLYAYSQDFKQIEAFFSKDRRLASILSPRVVKFLKSDALLKLPNSKPRAKPTVDKTVRVLRMFLVWSKETGRIASLPLPKDTPMGRSRLAGEEA
jgi:hypothetical protein